MAYSDEWGWGHALEEDHGEHFQRISPRGSRRPSMGSRTSSYNDMVSLHNPYGKAMGCDDKSMKHSPPRSYYHGSNYNYKSIKRTSSHNKLQMSGSYTAAASQMGSHSAGYGVNMYSGPVPTFSAVPIMMPMQPFSSPAYGYPYAPGAAAPMPMYAPMMGCSGPSMQDPVADAQKILQPFIWNTDSEDNGSHALVVAHSPNYNAPEKIKLLCEKYGTLYYCNQDFTRVCGVTFICYDDYRNAISAIRGLGQDIQQLLSKVSSPPPTKENDATVPTNSGEVFVAFTPILFSMNNSALTSRALRQSRSTSSLISLGQTIAAAGTSTPPRGLVATGPSSDSKGESDGASSAAAPDTAAMNTPVTVPNAIVPEANVLFQNVSTLMGQNIPSSFSVGSIQCVFQGYGQLRKITPLRAVSTESDKPEEFVSYSVEYYLLSEARYALNALSGLAQQIWGAGFEGEGRARSAVAAGGVRAVPTVRYSSLSADQSILAQQFHQCLYHWRWFVHHQQMLIASGNMPPVAPVPAIPQPLSSEHPPRTYDSVPVGGAEPAISPQAYLAMVEGVVDQPRSAGTDSAIARSKDSLSVGTEVPVPGRGVTSPLAIPPANREQGTHRSPSEYPAYGPRAPARLTSASVLGPETVPGAGRPIVPMHTTPRPQHHYGGHVPKKFQSTNEPLMESYDAGASRGDANSPVNVPGSGSATVRQGGNIVLNNTIDCVAIEDGLDTRVTVMIRNIPNKYTQQLLLDEINANHEGTYDFFYLPIDFKNRCNVGYAFISFMDARSIVPFFKEFQGVKWKHFNSEKICALTYARIQGKAAMINRFQNSSLLEKSDDYKPLLFYSDGVNKGKPEPFPLGSRYLSQGNNEGAI